MYANEYVSSVLFFSHPRSEGWLHHEPVLSNCLDQLTFVFPSRPTLLTLTDYNVLGWPLLCAGIVPPTRSFPRHRDGFRNNIPKYNSFCPLTRFTSSFSGTHTLSISDKAQRRLCFTLVCVCVSVCLSVSRLNQKLSMKFDEIIRSGAWDVWPVTAGLDFGGDPDHEADTGIFKRNQFLTVAG